VRRHRATGIAGARPNRSIHAYDRHDSMAQAVGPADTNIPRPPAESIISSMSACGLSSARCLQRTAVRNARYEAAA
jgi:hypothetical protein